MTNELSQKTEQLLALLRSLQRVAVAFSGGIDSTVVAQAAYLALQEKAIAVTADSPSVARREIADAKRLAQWIGIRHAIIQTEEFQNSDYLKNDGSRCYYCKSELYDQIISRMEALEVSVICSGANLDDRGDYRPGLKAAAERNIRHPLQEAGFTKSDVRAVAQFWGIPTWDKPASPCLSSRLAPGVAVTTERTARIEAAEDLLKELGLRDCRVRLHEGELARIEVAMSDLAKLVSEEVRSRLIQELKRFGFQFVTLDLEGFRSGSMNHLIDLQIKHQFTPQEVRS